MSAFTVREPKPGEMLGTSYLIEKELGRGGFGVVFKARHVEIDRIVAIKVLLATYASRDPSAKDRFRREATIAASLNYPNSLRVFDYGETDEGVFYLVMEFVSGQDLTKALQQAGRFTPPRAIHIIRQVLYALSEAHARGIVHRDIKPDNIMLSPLSYDADFVKVMDFGIAKMVEAPESITKAGMTLGTPRYMPVEQLKGERLAPSSDLYAVGLVLYELLVGTPAFTGETAVDTALAVMSGGTVKVPLEAGVDPGLARIIEKAAHRHAEDRYQSARELLEALDALGYSEGTTPSREPPDAGHRATIMMPELDRPMPSDGDIDDVTKTVSLDTSRVMPSPKPTKGLVDRMAATQAMPVLELPPSHRTHTEGLPKVETALVTSAMDRAGAPAPAPSAAPASPAPTPGGPTWLGASPLVVVLQVIAIILIVLLLVR
ncbi:MAG: serine/threonine protein kinase [Deltaproteobacteria bacterium]|nr:serine/threonine protein kinase [Deltaproteobacteria bacterium]